MGKGKDRDIQRHTFGEAVVYAEENIIIWHGDILTRVRSESPSTRRELSGSHRNQCCDGDNARKQPGVDHIGHYCVDFRIHPFHMIN